MMPASDPPPRGFTDAEYRARFLGVQHDMRTHDLAAILLTTEHDIRYYTGFHTQFWQSPTRPWFVVLPASGPKPIAVIPEIGVICMRKGWITDTRHWASPDPSDDGVSLLAETLVEVAGAAVDRIGINRGRETHVRMPLDDLGRLERTLGMRRGFADATAIIRAQRMVKSTAEIEKIRYVAQQVSGVFERVFEFVDIGRRDDEVFRDFRIECLRAGVDDVAYLVGAANTNGYDDIIAPPTGRRIGDADVLVLDTGCTFDGYYCDFDRNYGFGAVGESAKSAYRALWDATEAGLAAAMPGNTSADLFKAMNAVLSRAGALGDAVGRLGHGLGSQLTEPPSHTVWDQTELAVGMVLTLEPGMVFAPGLMMVHEENILITARGAELLSKRAPDELPIKK